MNFFGSNDNGNDNNGNKENLFDARVKASTRLTLRALVGGYIAYLGYKLMANGSNAATAAADAAEKHAPDWLRVLAGIIFMLAGAAFVVYSYIDYRKKKAAEEAAAIEAAREELEEIPLTESAVDIADCEKLAPLQAIYEKYLADVREAIENSKPTDGLLGLGSGPKDAACHDIFYKDVTNELDRLTAEGLSAGEAAAAAGYVLNAPVVNRGNELAFPMMFAASGLAGKLVSLLSPADADRLAIEYSEAFPKPERMPAQEKVLQQLYDRARG